MANSNVAALTADAVHGRRAVQLLYDGAWRVVHPHALGRSGRGRLALLAWQTAGLGRSAEPEGWRMFDLGRVAAVEPLQARGSSPRAPPGGWPLDGGDRRAGGGGLAAAGNDRHAAACGAACPPAPGSQTRNTAPSPAALSITSWPRCRLTMCLTIARPSPVPPALRERPASTR